VTRHGPAIRVGAALASVSTLVLTACGVPAGDGPQPVDTDIAQLLQPEATPSSTATTKPRLLTVTWVRGDKLVRTARLGAAETRQERLDAAIHVLLDGPRPVDHTRGFTTLLPPDVQVTGDVKRGRVVIELTVPAGLEPGGLPLAVGQVAVTALAVPRVRTVVFTIDGETTAVPLPDRKGPGRNDARVVRASDYRSVLAR
jgi:spore germination protein GerM